MNKATYLAQNDVIEFINWLVVNLPKLKISLRIKQSRFVPKGVSADITGFDNILSHYMWKSTGMTTGDWAETKARLTVLSNALRAAVNAGNHADTLDACDNILSWGGNRNRAVGAYKFLHSMAQGTLCPYIIDAGKAFSLNTASTAHLSPPVTRMNAMLTKVHRYIQPTVCRSMIPAWLRPLHHWLNSGGEQRVSLAPYYLMLWPSQRP